MASPTPAALREEAAAARAAILGATCCAAGEAGFETVVERVARAVADAEPPGEREQWAERFAARLRDGLFLPSIPTLSNAGLLGQLAACFVIEPVDSLDSIYASLARAARIQQRSGGVGVHLSRLRPRGAPIARTGGVSPGPVAFAGLFAHSARVNAMAGRRPGAHLAVLRDDHPDVLDFVRAKAAGDGSLASIGLAVGVSDALLEAARRGDDHALRHPKSGGARRVSARELLAAMAQSIVSSGEPTLLFLDAISAADPTPWLGPIEATNPCGEQPLRPNESCVLASLALPRLVRSDGSLDAVLLRSVVADAIRFLDDVVEVNAWVDEPIEQASRLTRKVGLGVMGLADCLLRAGTRYGGAKSQQLARSWMSQVADAAREASEALAILRGPYPAFRGPGPPRRHASTLAVAPTGTLRLIAGCNGGIEPLLQPVVRMHGEPGGLRWVDPWLLDWIEERQLPVEPLLDALAAGRSSRNLPGLGEADRELLAPAWEIAAGEQLAMQAAIQASVDGAVSKTVHLPIDATPEQVLDLIPEARAMGCKGLACYRQPPEAPVPGIDLATASAPCLDCGDL